MAWVTSLCFDKQPDTGFDCHRLCLRLNACQSRLPHAPKKKGAKKKEKTRRAATAVGELKTTKNSTKKNAVKRWREGRRPGILRPHGCSRAAGVFHTEVAGKWLHSTGEALSAVSTVILGHVVRCTHAHAHTHNCTHFKCCYDIKITALAKKKKTWTL